MRNLEFELGRIADCIVNDMLRIKKDDVVAITADSASNLDVVYAIVGLVHAKKGKPVVLLTPQFKGYQYLVDESVPVDLFASALINCDIWIDANSPDCMYSRMFDRVMAGNKKIRFYTLGTQDTATMNKIFGMYDVHKMIEFCKKIKELVQKSSTIRFTNPKGSDITFETNPNYPVLDDGGDWTKPGFNTLPAGVNIIPKRYSANGRIVFDSAYEVKPNGLLKEPITVIVKEGRIVDAEGGMEAEMFINDMRSWNDPNAFLVSHVNFGLIPTVKNLTGYVTLDERVWGVMNWGFGYTGAHLAPPDGIESNYHIDCQAVNISAWFDDVQIFDKGEVVHPELKKLYDEIIESILD